MKPCAQCIHAITKPHFRCDKGYYESKSPQNKYIKSYYYFAPGTGDKVGYYSDCKQFKHSKKHEAQKPIVRSDTAEPNITGEDNLGISSSFWNLLRDADPQTKTVGNYQTKTRLDNYTEVLSRL